MSFKKVEIIVFTRKINGNTRFFSILGEDAETAGSGRSKEHSCNNIPNKNNLIFLNHEYRIYNT